MSLSFTPVCLASLGQGGSDPKRCALPTAPLPPWVGSASFLASASAAFSGSRGRFRSITAIWQLGRPDSGWLSLLYRLGVLSLLPGGTDLTPHLRLSLGTAVARGRDFSPKSYIAQTSLGCRAWRVGILKGAQAVSTKPFSALIRISSVTEPQAFAIALN